LIGTSESENLLSAGTASWHFRLGAAQRVKCGKKKQWSASPLFLRSSFKR
jgi:hypothetical protein